MIDESRHPHLLEVLFSRRFWPLFWAQFLGAFNDNLIKMSTVLMITYAGVSVFGVPADGVSTLAPALLVLPALLFAAMSGQLADRYSKSQMIRPIKLWEVVLMGVASVGFIYRQPELLMIVIFFLGLQSTFFGPLKYSILPELLTDHELVAGNALVETGTNLAILIGTILGGILIAMDNGRIYVSIALVSLSVLGYLCSRSLVPTAAGSPELKVDWNPIGSTWEILKDVYETRTIFRAILAISWFWLYGFALVALFVPYAKNVLHANEQVQTFFLALFSVGVGVGSILCEKLSFGRLELGLVPFGSIGMSVFAADLYFAWKPSPGLDAQLLGIGEFLRHAGGVRVTADLVMIALFTGFYIVPLYTFIQSRAQAAVRSRVVAANNIVNSLFMAAWAGMQIWLMQYLTVIEILLLLSVLNFIVAVYIYTVIPEFFIRFCCYLVVHVMYRVRYRGLENIPAQGAAILVCNHVTFVDWLVISGIVPRPVRFVMDHSFMHIPIASTIMKQAHVIPIASHKENPELLQRAMEKVAAELREGELVCIFPEGRLTPDGRMCEFRKGIEHMVETTPVPVVPMALQGLWGSFFSRKDGQQFTRPFRRVWSRVNLIIGESIPAADVRADGLQHQVDALWRSGPMGTLAPAPIVEGTPGLA